VIFPAANDLNIDAVSGSGAAKVHPFISRELVGNAAFL